MEAQEIAERIRVPVRTVRYVLEHKMVPDIRGKVVKGRAGRPRSFSAFESFCVALAAVLYQEGCQRLIVANTLAALAATPWPLPWSWSTNLGMARPTLASPVHAIGRCQSALNGLHEAGDGRVLLMIGDGGAALQIELTIEVGGILRNSGWFSAGVVARLSGYQPRLMIRVEVHMILAALVDRKASNEAV
jgi:hypothetical protein